MIFIKQHKLIVFLTLVLFIVASANGIFAQGVEKDESLRKGETRATLDPNQFSNPELRKAYQIAKDIPWVLDSIYCYCMCRESPVFRHKSLLSCYVDNHAAM